MSASNKDQSLLDRLNALKGGNDAGISLDRSSNALNVSIGVEKAKPPTKEDALAARLRSLRNTPDRETAPAASPSKNITSPSGPSGSLPADESVFDTDDQTLEELLGAGDDDPQDPPSWAAAAKVDEGRAQALIEELSRGITPSDIKPDGHRTSENPDDERPPDPDEDSDGEEMSRDVRTLLARALDEAELEAKLNPPSDPKPSSSPPSSSPDGPPGDDPLSLPSVPSALGSSDDTGLSLPSVPTTVGARSPEDLEADLAARMAALSIPPSGSGDPDIGLPSVPTDQPANRLRSRTGYTDADQEKWCTVCLEDATLRCLGCDDDVYCTRCWWDMHLGPTAAFDDRTHKAVLFGKDPRKKEKKTLVGA